jgi:NitT/TauT family transport system permease protein
MSASTDPNIGAPPESGLSVRTTERLIAWGSVLGMFVVWELICVVFDVPVFILPRPTIVIETLVRLWTPIMRHTTYTLWTTLIGFGLAIAFGVLLGTLVGAWRLLYNGLYPVLIGFNSVPKVALVPVLVIWFGFGPIPAVLTAFSISFFPIVVNVATGIATMEPEMQDVLRSLGAKKHQILLKVGLPRSLPYFYASLKVAVTLAFVGSVIAETVTGNRGVGYLMVDASSRFDAPVVFAGLLVLSFMGVGLYLVFAEIERRTTRWAHRGQDMS